jgi:spermidine synthase
MGFEIAAVRVLTPYFGNTMYTWGAIISTFLTGSMIGYWYGGKNADRPHSQAMVVFYLLVGMAAVAAAPIVAPILRSFDGLPNNTGVLMGCLLLFLLPNVMLSAIVPAITKEGLSLSFSGTQIGRFHTVSAVGSIAGTILVTFWLLPATSLDVVFSLFTGGLVLALLIYLSKVYKKKTVLMVPCLAFCLFPFIQSQEGQINAPGTRIIAEQSSPYHNVYVVESNVRNGVEGRYRYMQFGPKGYQGGINLDKPDDVLFKYARHFQEIGEKLIPDMERVFIIGHGVGTTARHYEKLGKTVTSAEIDPVVVEMSKKYFMYEGNSVVLGDGRKLLSQEPDHSIDYLVLDAYSNDVVPFHLTTNEFFSMTKDKLSHNGVLAMNVIGKLRGDEVLNSIYSTIANNYPFVRVYANDHEEEKLQNITIIASHSLIEQKEYSAYFEVQLNPGEIITDSSTKFSRLN